MILVSVALERSNVRERFRLRYTEEELGNNLTLMSKLKLEFGVDLPGMQPANGFAHALRDEDVLGPIDYRGKRAS